MSTIPHILTAEMLLEHITATMQKHSGTDTRVARQYYSGQIDALEALARAACIPAGDIRAAISAGSPPRKLAPLVPHAACPHCIAP